MKLKKCRTCGKLFEPASSRQLDCNQPITKTCVVCGNTFEGRCSQNDKNSCCSKECVNKLASANRQKSYGESHTRICELCGKEFHPRSNTQRVCDGEHFSTCVVCGKQFKLNYKSAIGQVDLRKTCSEKCLRAYQSTNNAMQRLDVQEKLKATMRAKYGVEYAAQSPELLAKQRATTHKRYGTDYFVQTKQYIAAAEATNLSRYGTAWPMQSKEIQEKRAQTNMLRYGADDPMKNPEIATTFLQSYNERTGYATPLSNPEVQEKSKQTLLDRYGVEHYSQTEEFQEKFTRTSMERYGTSNPMQNAEIQKKAQDTSLQKYGATSYMASDEGRKRMTDIMQEKYGVTQFTQTREWKLAHMNRCDNIDEWMKFSEDPEVYINANYPSELPTYKQLADQLGVAKGSVQDLMERRKLTQFVSKYVSTMEQEVCEFLDSINIKYIQHDRSIIKPLEIDIYIPEYKLGIECDPTMTHNSSTGDPWGGLPKSYTYHKQKTDLCNQVGVDLFHIFGYDWEHHEEIIKSMIASRVHRNARTIYARKCKVVTVQWDDALKFLLENHRQGSASSLVRLGLEYEGKLVSLMTFGHMRESIGTSKEDTTDCWELVRFCSLLNTSVIGGASKLLKHFIKDHEPKRIRSFSDRAHTSGQLYPTLGFKEVRRSDPGYVWVDTLTDKAFHRINAQRQNIKQFLKDDSIDLTQTETQIMIEHGFVQVFDSGTVTWEWPE